jgi:hypothetical protein
MWSVLSRAEVLLAANIGWLQVPLPSYAVGTLRQPDRGVLLVLKPGSGAGDLNVPDIEI